MDGLVLAVLERRKVWHLLCSAPEPLADDVNKGMASIQKFLLPSSALPLEVPVTLGKANALQTIKGPICLELLEMMGWKGEKNVYAN